MNQQSGKQNYCNDEGLATRSHRNQIVQERPMVK
jgi:hypothetical protein